MFHPAALLSVWTIGVVAVQSLAGMPLSALLLIVAVAAGWQAPLRSAQLLRRTRWLLISLFAIYLLGTPGEFLPGWVGAAGVTREGVILGVEHLARLLVLLLSLAVLHQYLGTGGMLTGLHRLLQPFPGRNVMVVRLMLVLDLVEQRQPQHEWKTWLQPGAEEAVSAAPASAVLATFPLRRQDVGLILLAILVAVCLGLS